jgi:hypothetical protein
MGNEAKCTLTFRRTRTEGKALLETDALIFRGGVVRLSVPYRNMSGIEAKDGALRITFSEGLAVFDLGAVASKWADKIRNPPSRLEKLGVKAGHRVLVLGLKDEEFSNELRARGVSVMTRLTGCADIIFVTIERREALDKLRAVQKNLERDGAVWVIRPKGVDAITENDVMKAGKAAGLVDVKVVRFSDTYTAEKFVIPVAKR